MNPINRDLTPSLDRVAGTPVGLGQPTLAAEGFGTNSQPKGASVIFLAATQLDALLQKVVGSVLASKNPDAGAPSLGNLDNLEIEKKCADQNNPAHRKKNPTPWRVGGESN